MSKSEIEKVLKIIENHANNEKYLCGLFIPKSSFKILANKIVEMINDSKPSQGVLERIEK